MNKFRLQAQLIINYYNNCDADTETRAMEACPMCIDRVPKIHTKINYVKKWGFYRIEISIKFRQIPNTTTPLDLWSMWQMSIKWNFAYNVRFIMRRLKLARIVDIFIFVRRQLIKNSCKHSLQIRRSFRARILHEIWISRDFESRHHKSLGYRRFYNRKIPRGI